MVRTLAAASARPTRVHGETPEGVREAIGSMGERIAGGLSRQALIKALAPGAARNALDCALIDLETKQSGRAAVDLLGAPIPDGVLTCYTLSLASPAEMARQAALRAELPLLKLKLGGPGDADRMRAVRARPDARLVADANEGWSEQDLEALFESCGRVPLRDDRAAFPPARTMRWPRSLMRCPSRQAESVHVATDLTSLRDRYDGVNLKLDKTGGLTAALATARLARSLGFDIMVGSMVATSLAMAPALHLAALARWVDLDGPLLLARDRTPGMVYERGWITPPGPDLWG